MIYILYKTNTSKRFVDFINIETDGGRVEFLCPFCRKTHAIKITDLAKYGYSYKCVYTNRKFSFVKKNIQNIIQYTHARYISNR